MGDNEPGRDIIVVSGHPRSGTSLMMQMLEVAGVPILRDDERPPDASNPNGYYELSEVKATMRDPGWIARAPGHAVKVIHALLPHLARDRSYRVILMQRDLSEVIDSQARMLEAGGHSRGVLPDSRLREIYATQLDEARRLLEQEPCFDWIEVRYADLIARGRQSIEAIERFLALPAASQAMNAAIDPSLYRSRETVPAADNEA
jgi:hypothetical protein